MTSISPPVYDCSGTIDADSDIGGPGVAAAFLAVSWLTVLLSGIPAFHEAQRAFRAAKEWRQRHDGVHTDSAPKYAAFNWFSTPIRPFSSADGQPDEEQEEQDPYPPPLLVLRIRQLLGPICDLQAITGIAIVVSGWSQWRSINFYHEQLVQNYWNLTLNSFWAARIDYMELNAKDHPLRLFFRRLVIFASCIIGTAWQIYVYNRENGEHTQWGPENTQPCYNYRDGTSSRPWIIGLLIYCVALFLALTKWTNLINNWYFDGNYWVQEHLVLGWRASYNACKTAVNTLRSAEVEARKKAVRSETWLVALAAGFSAAIFGFLVFLYWWVYQWLAVWSYGDGFYPFLWFAYIGFDIWNTFDTVTLVVLNRSLLQSSEYKWSFGQVLPLIMILAIGINVLDTWTDLKLKEQYDKAVKKLDEEQPDQRPASAYVVQAHENVIEMRDMHGANLADDSDSDLYANPDAVQASN